MPWAKGTAVKDARGFVFVSGTERASTRLLALGKE